MTSLNATIGATSTMCCRYDCQLLYLVTLGTARANEAASLIAAVSEHTSTVLMDRAAGDRSGRGDWEGERAVGPHCKRAGAQHRTTLVRQSVRRDR
jgi:hypothetical protein